ncbi:hypothetical protein QE152_g40605, partial [Popillia japonica]
RVQPDSDAPSVPAKYACVRNAGSPWENIIHIGIKHTDGRTRAGTLGIFVIGRAAFLKRFKVCSSVNCKSIEVLHYIHILKKRKSLVTKNLLLI